MSDLIKRNALMIALMDKGLDHIQADDLTEINQIVEELPSMSVCNDAISREAVLNYIRDNYRRWFINDTAFKQCLDGLKQIVSVVSKGD